MKRRTTLILYVLSIYVILQFIWWGYHLIELTQEVANESLMVNKRVTMILGEGAVFLLILVIGIWQIQKSIRKDIRLSERQNNFLLSVTHELKTPMAANKLYIQTVMKRDLSKEQSNELLLKAIEENNRLERMIDNILNASRLENKALLLTKESFDLFRLGQFSIDRFQQLFPKATFTLEMKENTQIVGDRLLIETILTNLIENALKYAGPEAIITLYASASGSTIKFGIKDNGPGVSGLDREEIFKKFYRSGSEDTRTQKGSGLGLYIVRELIRLHGGKITYSDNLPQGANFQLEI
ncbi:MAG: K+-sensing histidine kinase KdpD [Crocinitomicaceae bacterium]|jgi:K+-sensing histidine kinase KdpD